MSVQIEVVDNPGRACSAMMVGAAAGPAHLVLAGGSTPKVAYEEFVEAVKTVGVDLTQAHFWFGDDRAVSADDEESNYRMVKESLLDRLTPGAGEPHVHRIRGELGFAPAAEAYERELRDAGPPEFELLLIGMGPDGHVLSLFPDQPTLSERERLVIGVPEAGHEPYVPRVSFTLPALRLARKVVFLIEGSAKADVVAKAFGPDAQPDPSLPASLVPGWANDVVVLLDAAAAERLP
jgi:6-phosphogluconolactonase